MGIHPYLDAKKLAVESGLIDPLSSGYFFDIFFLAPEVDKIEAGRLFFLRGWQEFFILLVSPPKQGSWGL